MNAWVAGGRCVDEFVERDTVCFGQRKQKFESRSTGTGRDDRLVGVRLSDGTVVDREVLAVAPRMKARAEFLSELGLHPAGHPSGLGEHIPADATGHTAVPGVWVAGNATDLAAQVGNAAAAGSTAAGQINADLVAEDTRRAVAAYRDPFLPENETRLCELAMGARRHGL